MLGAAATGSTCWSHFCGCGREFQGGARRKRCGSADLAEHHRESPDGVHPLAVCVRGGFRGRVRGRMPVPLFPLGGCAGTCMSVTPLPLAAPQAIVSALRENTTIESIGLSHIQEGAERLRGDAPRLDPKKPDGHYRLDLAQPWDSFVCETLYDRMQARGVPFLSTSTAHPTRNYVYTSKLDLQPGDPWSSAQVEALARST